MTNLSHAMRIPVVRELLKLFLFVILFTVLLIYLRGGFPIYIWWVIFIVGVLFIIISIIKIDQTMQSDVRERMAIPGTPSPHYPNETIISVVQSISSKRRHNASDENVAILLSPENTLVLTDKRIIFASFPSTVTTKFLSKSRKPSVHPDHIKQTMSPQEVLKMHKRNFEIPYKSIKEIHFRSLFDKSIEFITTADQGVMYIFYSDKSYEKSMKTLKKICPKKVFFNKKLKIKHFA